MMKRNNILMGLFLGLSLLFACEDDSNRPETAGYIELGVSKNVEVVTRAVDVQSQSLAVDICVGANDSVVKHFSDYNDMAGKRILLDVGTYKVKVSSDISATGKMVFEKPSFYGEKTGVTVKAGVTTPVSVECRLNCVKVTTEFTKPVQSKFSSCTAKISDGNGYLEYGMNETRAGYYQPGYLLVDLTVANQEGMEFKMSKLIEKTEERDHYHLIFDLVESGDNNSGMNFDISIETDPTNDENHTVTIPLPETGYKQDPPVIDVTGVDADGILSLDKGDPASMSVNITSEYIGLNTVSMLVTSALFEGEEIPSVLDLMNLSDAGKEKLEKVGFVPVVSEDKSTCQLDFNTLITNLPGGTHTFVIAARDALGHEAVRTITIQVNLQVMTHPVVESEVWAHYATLRGYVKNASETDKKNYKFQYKESLESTWQDVTGDVTVSPGASSNITQVVTHLKPGTEYEYRLVEGDSPVDGSETFTTEEAAVLPGGNFDDKNNGPWNITDKMDNPSTFWSSGNNSFARDLATEKVDEGRSVAYLKSAWKVIKFAAGNAFTGRFTLHGMEGGTVTLGKKFSSRPSSLKGKYKYNSKKVDHGGNKIENGVQDKCAIYIVLLTEPIGVNTTDSKTLDIKSYFKDKIVAISELPDEMSGSTEGYQNFELVLDYKMPDIKSIYLGIMCTSSKYGDYFQGAEDSELYIDDFELVYDQAPGSAE